MKSLISQTELQHLIYLVRGHRVMLDRDLADLYGVPTKVLNQAVRRNRKRFPSDFMFQMNRSEFKNWRSQIVASNFGVRMGLRRPPYVFTEHGVAMLSSVLNSERAVEINIAIIRAFVELRRTIAAHKELAKKIARHERKIRGLSSDVLLIFNLIQPLLDGPVKKLGRIGF